MKKFIIAEVGFIIVFLLIVFFAVSLKQSKSTTDTSETKNQNTPETTESTKEGQDIIQKKFTIPKTLQGSLMLGFYSDIPQVSLDIEHMHASGMPLPTIVGTFRSPAEASGVTANNLNEIKATGAIPFINIMVPGTAADIAQGVYDNIISAQCTEIRSAMEGRPIIITPLPESNGTWTSYGNDPVNFKKSFAKIQKLCPHLNALWAWAPNQSNQLSAYEPDDYDIIAPSLFGFDENTIVDVAVMEHIERIADFTDKPIIIGQTGTCAQGSAKSDWVRDLIQKTTQHPQVLGFLYFNYYKPNEGECNWKVWESGIFNAGWINTLKETDIIKAEEFLK